MLPVRRDLRCITGDELLDRQPVAPFEPPPPQHRPSVGSAGAGPKTVHSGPAAFLGLVCTFRHGMATLDGWDYMAHPIHPSRPPFGTFRVIGSFSCHPGRAQRRPLPYHSQLGLPVIRNLASLSFQTQPPLHSQPGPSVIPNPSDTGEESQAAVRSQGERTRGILDSSLHSEWHLLTVR